MQNLQQELSNIIKQENMQQRFGIKNEPDALVVIGQRLPATTPVPNLFLTGAWVSGGGMSSALLSGRSTARRVTRFLEKQSG